jgi:hypothetical protein
MGLFTLLLVQMLAMTGSMDLSCVYALHLTNGELYVEGVHPTTGKSPDLRRVTYRIELPGLSPRRYLSDAAISPSRKLIALSLSDGSLTCLLAIIDVKHQQVISMRRVTTVLDFPWFKWIGGDKLVVLRRDASSPSSKPKVRADISTSADRYVSFREPDASENHAAARLLHKWASRHIRLQEASKRLDAASLLPPIKPAPGGEPSIEWRPYLDLEYEGAVSADGKAIAVLASASVPSGRDGPATSEYLYLLRAGTGWTKERLMLPRLLRFVRFQGGMLIAGDGDAPESRQQRKYTAGTLRNRLVHLFYLADPKRKYTIKCDVVALPSEQ